MSVILGLGALLVLFVVGCGLISLSVPLLFEAKSKLEFAKGVVAFAVGGFAIFASTFYFVVLSGVV